MVLRSRIVLNGTNHIFFKAKDMKPISLETAVRFVSFIIQKYVPGIQRLIITFLKVFSEFVIVPSQIHISQFETVNEKLSQFDTSMSKGFQSTGERDQASCYVWLWENYYKLFEIKSSLFNIFHENPACTTFMFINIHTIMTSVINRLVPIKVLIFLKHYQKSIVLRTNS